MIDVSPEKARARYDALPQHLKEVLLSEKAANVIWDWGEANHLSEEKIKVIANLTGAVILGFLHPEDLAKEIREATGLPAPLSQEVADEANKKIFAPILEEIKRIYHWGDIPPTSQAAAPSPSPESPTTPSPVAPAPASPPESAPLKPQPPTAETTPPTAPPPPPASPYILHKEEEIEAVAETAGASQLIRPVFFSARETDKREPPVRARLELGGEEEKGETPPPVASTEKPVIRMVNYLGPNTPVDPFAPRAEEPGGKTESSPPQDPNQPIHPKNIVNLKDLPYEEGKGRS